MKNLINSVLLTALVLISGATAARANSGAASTSDGSALTHAGAASVHLLQAGAESGSASLKVVSGVAAVPLWMSGAVVTGAGALSGAVGDVASGTGAALGEAGRETWDFATGETSRRPAMNRETGLPKKTVNRPPQRDPSPAEMLRATR